MESHHARLLVDVLGLWRIGKYSSLDFYSLYVSEELLYFRYYPHPNLLPQGEGASIIFTMNFPLSFQERVRERSVY